MDKDRLIIEERPKTEVFVTASGFISIRQVIRDEETAVVLTADEALAIADYLRHAAEELRNGSGKRG